MKSETGVSVISTRGKLDNGTKLSLDSSGGGIRVDALGELNKS